MWCETYSESPRLIPETAMTAFTPRPPKTLPRVPGRARAATRRTGSTRSGRRARRCRTSTTPGRSPRSVLLGNVALRFPGTRLMWDGAEHEDHQRARGQPVRPAQLPPGLVAVGRCRLRAPGCRLRASVGPLQACSLQVRSLSARGLSAPELQHSRAPSRVPRRADATAGSESSGRASSRDVRRFSHEAMATVFEVYAVHPDDGTRRRRRRRPSTWSIASSAS